jgi:hypothetical protein
MSYGTLDPTLGSETAAVPPVWPPPSTAGWGTYYTWRDRLACAPKVVESQSLGPLYWHTCAGETSNVHWQRITGNDHSYPADGAKLQQLNALIYLWMSARPLP